MPDAIAEVAVYALDVGQGDCTFVVSSNAADGTVLFDCKDPYVAERFVVDHGIDVLHAIVISHLDADHIAGVLPFMRWMLGSKRAIRQVFVGLDRARSRIGVAASRLAEALLKWAGEGRFTLHAPQREGKPREVWTVPGRWSVAILAPRYDDLLEMRIDGDEEPNRCSVALRVACAGRAILVGGDAPLVSWERVEPPLLPALGFRAPHHGGAIADDAPDWTEVDLYNAVSPDLVAISVGTRNQYGHPTDQHLLGINPARRRLVCTQLTPRCHNDVSGVRAEMLRTASRVTYAPYRHVQPSGSNRRRPRNEVPCAGTIAMELFTDGTMRVEPPSPGWHTDQIRLLRLSSPRCQP